jgi:hypothetical protein
VEYEVGSAFPPKREAGVTHVIEQSQFTVECKIGSMSSIESHAPKAQSALIRIVGG